MRIGTWNVEYAPDARLDVLRRVMSVHKADIWVLTETHDALVPEGAQHGAHSDPRPRQREGSRWVSIWTRYPVLEQIECADARRTVCALLDIGEGRQLLVYGTVMPWGTDQGDDPPEEKVLGWSEHNRVVPLQCAEWLDIRHKYPDALLCAAGDFNTDMSRASRYGTREGIAALTQGIAAAGLYCATAPGRIPDWCLPIAPIDHIALPLEWTRAASVVAAWPAFKGVISDHSGLIVEIDEEMLALT